MLRMTTLLSAAAMLTSVASSVAASDAKVADRGQAVSSKQQKRECRLEVDGKVEVAGRCWVDPEGGPDDYTLNTWDHGKPRYPHFAVVSTNGDGTADVTWNADPADDHAWDKLGTARKQNGCWVNARVRVCAR